MVKFIKLAWRNMWRNWRRTAIAMIAIVLGMILLVFMNGIMAGSDEAIFGNAVRLYGGNIQIHAPGYRERASRMPLLPLEDADAAIQAAKAQPQVVAAMKRINTGGMLVSGGGTYPVVITAVEPAVEAPISLLAENISQGRFLAPEDEDAVLIGQGLADLLGVSAGDRVTLLGREKSEAMRQHTMTVVGVYDLGLAEAEKGTVYIPLSAAQTLYKLRDQVTEVSINLNSVGKESATLTALQAALPGYEVDSWQTLRPELRQVMDVKTVVLTIFGFVVLLIASIGILNLMMMAAFERTREMGVLASLGLKGRGMVGLFLLEGTFIGALGAAIGCVLGTGVVLAVAQVGIDYSAASSMGEITALMGDRIYPVVTITQTIAQGLAVAVIAALASLYPAWQASRKEPAESLHHI